MSSSCSQIPGNIGTLKSRVLIWDHDPMLARSNQDIHFPLNSNIKAEVPRKALQNIEMVDDSIFLKPVTALLEDMFVATKRQDEYVYVDDEISTQYLPGGSINENTAFSSDTKNKFPHRLWIHTGSIFSKTVLIHPDEYEKNTEELLKRNENNGATMDDLYNAPKWKMIVDQETQSIMPGMIAKHSPVNTNEETDTVHWTLSKLTNLWHGEDFIITINKGEKNLDTQRDPLSLIPDDKEIPSQLKFTDTKNTDYIHLMPNPSSSTIQSSTSRTVWKDGVSNEAVSIQTRDKKGTINVDQKASRLKYWWKYKSYILVEFGDEQWWLGHGDGDVGTQRYFIELVKGRNPRFLQIGPLYGIKDPNQDFSTEEGKINGFGVIRKSRVISEYQDVSCNDLFDQKSFFFTVRHHLGELYIVFSGHEGNPWKITRYDNKKSDDGNLEEIQVPIYITNAPCKIHGGNISCSINFSPLSYASGSTVPLSTMQADTKNAHSSDTSIVFSNMGNSNNFRSRQDNKRIKPIGYSCEANSVFEHNGETNSNLHKVYPNQYSNAVGKGYWKGRRTQGHGSEIRIIDRNNKNFTIGAKDGKNKYSEYISKFDADVMLTAGNVEIPPEDLEHSVDPTVGTAKFFNTMTPIATGIRSIIKGDVKPIYDNIDEPIDITDLVASMSDSWSVEEYHVIRHEMNMKCYIPVGHTDSSSKIYNLGQQLLELKDKTMYITVSYWWEGGVGEKNPAGLNIKFHGDSKDNQALIQMTGVAYGGELERSNNQLYFNLNIKDYMSILEHQYMFNSPFFDAVNDAVAIYEIAQMAGFDDSEFESHFLRGRKKGNIDRRPLGYLQKMIRENNHGKITTIYNGDRFFIPIYALPGSYADIAKPAMRFSNGERMLDAMKKIAQISGKTVYFDRYGVLKFERSAATEVAFYSGRKSSHLKDLQVKYDFITSPRTALLNADETSGIVKPFKFDPEKDASHLVYNLVKYRRSVEDAVNQVSLFSATTRFTNEFGEKLGGLLVEGYTFFDQIFDPSVEGFHGFRKVFYQSNGLFGDTEGIKNAIRHYAKMKFPPFITSFETYGVPGLKPLDIVAIDNNPAYITEISHDLDPSTNRWWMNITAEWLKPYVDELAFAKTEIEEFPPL